MNESKPGGAGPASSREATFLATLAHELRNPLAPIVTALDLMRLRPDDAAVVARARETIARQVNELNRIIDALSATSRAIESEAAPRRNAAPEPDDHFAFQGEEPLFESPSSGQPFRPGTQEPTRETEASESARKVLIVDDNIDAAESLGEFLKASGYRIHIVHDGASALTEAARLRPEVVILDIGMPAMDGYQVAQRLRNDVGLTASLLVAITGYTEERDRATAREAGFDLHFAKPVDILRLASVLPSAH